MLFLVGGKQKMSTFLCDRKSTYDRQFYNATFCTADSETTAPPGRRRRCNSDSKRAFRLTSNCARVCIILKVTFFSACVL